jgi:hypothetical protein
VEDGRLGEKHDYEQQFKEEIAELKDSVERKEFLLQYNEQKYYQYEKVLRELILSRDTDEATREHLRCKIEQQELFVPKEDRKITNTIQHNQELLEQVANLKAENQKL